MTWQNVTVMTADTAAPEQLQATNAALVERAAELARDRREIDDRIAKLGESDLSPKTLKAMDAVREAKIVSWQAESTLRSDYAAWLDEYHAATVRLIEQATQNRQQAEDDLRARLVAIGYVTGPGTELLPERIIPDFLMRHPSVRAARFRQADIEAIQTSITTVQSANEKARTETTAQMAQYRDRMLSAV